jgi:hypothetical protein
MLFAVFFFSYFGAGLTTLPPATYKEIADRRTIQERRNGASCYFSTWEENNDPF